MPEQDEGNLKSNLGISRRDLLKRGAVVGGTVLWATPAIQTLGSKAFAQGGVPGTKDAHGCCFCFSSANCDDPNSAAANPFPSCNDDGLNNAARASEDACRDACATDGYSCYQWGTDVAECGCNTPGQGPLGCGANCRDAIGSTAA
jgi:hypothetical protein